MGVREQAFDASRGRRGEKGETEVSGKLKWAGKSKRKARGAVFKPHSVQFLSPEEQCAPAGISEEARFSPHEENTREKMGRQKRGAPKPDAEVDDRCVAQRGEEVKWRAEAEAEEEAAAEEEAEAEAEAERRAERRAEAEAEAEEEPAAEKERMAERRAEAEREAETNSGGKLSEEWNTERPEECGCSRNRLIRDVCALANAGQDRKAEAVQRVRPSPDASHALALLDAVERAAQPHLSRNAATGRVEVGRTAGGKARQTMPEGWHEAVASETGWKTRSNNSIPATSAFLEGESCDKIGFSDCS